MSRIIVSRGVKGLRSNVILIDIIMDNKPIDSVYLHVHSIIEGITALASVRLQFITSLITSPVFFPETRITYIPGLRSGDNRLYFTEFLNFSPVIFLPSIL